MTYLHKLCYSRHFLRQEITRTKKIARNETLLLKSATTITEDKSECVPFIVTYNPALIHHSQTCISNLTSSQSCHNILKSAPIVAFRHSNNLTTFLVWAKLRSPSQNNIPHRGSFAAVIVLRAPTRPTHLIHTHLTRHQQNMEYSENLVRLPEIETQRSFLFKHEFKLKL